MAYDMDEVPIGAIVVINNKIIGRGHNLTEKLTDVTAHAEMQAITAASSYLGAKYLNDCTLYVTLEPCLMCAGAIFWSQLGKLIYAAPDLKRGYSAQGGQLHPKTKLQTGILEEESKVLLQSFFAQKRL